MKVNRCPFGGMKKMWQYLSMVLWTGVFIGWMALIVAIVKYGLWDVT